MSKDKPCILCASRVDASSMEQAKLELVVAGTVRTRKAPVFSTPQGVEGLFHVINKFLKAASKPQCSAADKWDAFEEVLDTTAESKWMNLIGALTQAQKSNARFTPEMRNSVGLHAKSDEPRDVLIECLKSDACLKEKKTATGVPASRIETLCAHANRLDGTEADLNAEQIKKIVFGTFPKSWRNDCKNTHFLANETSMQVTGFINLCKGIADENNANHGKKLKASNDPEERIRGGGSNSTKKQNGNGNMKKANGDAKVQD